MHTGRAEMSEVDTHNSSSGVGSGGGSSSGSGVGSGSGNGSPSHCSRSSSNNMTSSCLGLLTYSHTILSFMWLGH